jgi:hypothetical protein
MKKNSKNAEGTKITYETAFNNFGKFYNESRERN